MPGGAGSSTAEMVRGGTKWLMPGSYVGAWSACAVPRARCEKWGRQIVVSRVWWLAVWFLVFSAFSRRLGVKCSAVRGKPDGGYEAAPPEVQDCLAAEPVTQNLVAALPVMHLPSAADACPPLVQVCPAAEPVVHLLLALPPLRQFEPEAALPVVQPLLAAFPAVQLWSAEPPVVHFLEALDEAGEAKTTARGGS